MTALDQKVVVVAGGATGIGAETARQLVSAGARVIVGDINEDGGRRHSLRRSVTGHSSSVSTSRTKTRSKRSSMERLPHSVGSMGSSPMPPISAPACSATTPTSCRWTAETWHRSLAVDLTGFFYTARHAVPHLLARRGWFHCGHQLCGGVLRRVYVPGLLDLEGRSGCAGASHRQPMGVREGIRCNAVAPGLVLSDELRPKVPAERQEAYLGSQLLSRLGEPRTSPPWSPSCSRIRRSGSTGQIFGVDGGMVLR